ncbi:MAG: hypothetical protein Q7S65_05175 [Nanoarchaeota archaeon]|nr:hypothetical protein [Nanoarchaeota archaeon]
MSDEIDRWVKYMKAHPDTWKKIHTQFINAQFEKAYAFMERLKRQPGGKAKIIEMYGIKKGYPSLFD